MTRILLSTFFFISLTTIRIKNFALLLFVSFADDYYKLCFLEIIINIYLEETSQKLSVTTKINSVWEMSANMGAIFKSFQTKSTDVEMESVLNIWVLF